MSAFVPGARRPRSLRPSERAPLIVAASNTSPALDTPELVRFVYDRGERADCRVFPVAAATRVRLDALAWSYQVLPALQDIDVPADLVHLPFGA